VGKDFFFGANKALLMSSAWHWSGTWSAGIKGCNATTKFFDQIILTNPAY
jgi:hypothetical protein